MTDENDVERTWVEFDIDSKGISVSLYKEYPNGEVVLLDEYWEESAPVMAAADPNDEYTINQSLE